MANLPAQISDHELLVRIHNQNAEQITILRSINSKATFFVVALVLAIGLQACATIMSL